MTVAVVTERELAVALLILAFVALFMVYVWTDLSELLRDQQALDEVGAGGSSARRGSVATVPPGGLTATAGASCTCDPAFYPDAVDADCPRDGLAAFSRSRVFDHERLDEIRTGA